MNIDENNIIYGGPVAKSATKNVGSVGRFVLKQLKEAGKRVLLIPGTTRNVVVGICSENRIKFAVVALAKLCLNATMAPMNVSYTERFIKSLIKDYKVNMALMVPPLLTFLAKHPDVEKYDLPSLQTLLRGAAPLNNETEDAVEERIGVPVVRQGFGLSKSTLSFLVQTQENNKPGSAGVLRPGSYGKVIDTETGKPLGSHERGELSFKGPVIIMKGYVNDEKATRATIDEDGWLHTGDIGYYDNDLEFFIVDRIKELIKYKAFQVPPEEIESILLTHPSIKDAGVVGLPDESSGELPFAFVVKQSDVKLTEKEVVDYVADRVSSAKRLRGGARFVKEIPKNPSGKILRRMLRDLLKKVSKSKL